MSKHGKSLPYGTLSAPAEIAALRMAQPMETPIPGERAAYGSMAALRSAAPSCWWRRSRWWRTSLRGACFCSWLAAPWPSRGRAAILLENMPHSLAQHVSWLCT